MRTPSITTRFLRMGIALSLALTQAMPSAHADNTATASKSKTSRSLVTRVRVGLLGAPAETTALSLAGEMEAAKTLKDAVAVIEKVNKSELSMNERLVIYDRISPDILSTSEKYEAAAAHVTDFTDLPYLAELIYVISLDSKIQSSNMLGLNKYRLQRSLRTRFAATLSSWYRDVGSQQSNQTLQISEPSETETSPRSATAAAANSVQDRVIALSTALLAGVDEQERQQILKNQKAWVEVVRSEMKDAFDAQQRRPWQSESKLGGLHNILLMGSVWSVFSPLMVIQLVMGKEVGNAGILVLGGLICATILAVDYKDTTKERLAPIRTLYQQKEAALDAFFTHARENRARYQCIGAISGSTQSSN